MKPKQKRTREIYNIFLSFPQQKIIMYDECYTETEILTLAAYIYLDLKARVWILDVSVFCMVCIYDRMNGYDELEDIK